MKLNGVININKPAGVTSHDVVDSVRRVCGIRRVGHTGTLDPMATGVLPICVGGATKISQYLMAFDKEYLVDMRLGLTTASQDTTGETLEEKPWDGVTEGAVRVALSELTGALQQVPPMVSAKKQAGKRLYELAREGVEVEREPCAIHIFEMELLEFAPPLVRYRTVCSKGTYVRTLCHDLGQKLKCGAAMSGLVRSRSGAFHVDDAVTLDSLQTPEDVAARLVSMADALSVMPSLGVREEAQAHIRHGRPIPGGMVDQVQGAFAPGRELRVLDAQGELLCIATASVKSELLPRLGGSVGVAQPVRVFQDTDEDEPQGRRGRPRHRSGGGPRREK